MEKPMDSPYLKDVNRLADVISAIQVMGSYKFYKLDFKGWAKRISGDETLEEHWKQVFKDHPEFFRFNQEKDKASLAWRRSKQRTYHVDKNVELTRIEVEQLAEDEKATRISRVPLSSSDIATLISTAVNLHSRALEDKKDDRWWITPMIGIAGSLFGVVLGILLKYWLDSA